MTTRIGFAIIFVGLVLIVLRWIGVLNTEVADIASVMSIVLGALAVAIDGEEADQPKRRPPSPPAASPD